ncbi:MAG: 16S rRNA (adenine(1518)-N(6)/adenine(1519)-N(6))-dimethyltransferase RsmA, partial [Gammaproteobacteria bacterium]
DPAVVAAILRAAAPGPRDHFLEIGPGEGALTRPLLERVGRLDAVELDRDLAARLEAELGADPRLRVLQGDALRLDLAALAGPGGRLRVIGNLPYNVSTPLLFHLLAQREHVADMLFMLQREVVDRLAAAPGSRTYGRLSVMAQLACRVEPLFRVPPGAFRPPPRVASRMVRLVPHPRPPVAVGDEAAFARVVSAAFGQRRKRLGNALRGLLDAEAIRAAGVDPGARAEALDLAAFAALARAVAARGAAPTGGPPPPPAPAGARRR